MLMRLHERVLCPYPVAKYATAFFRMSRSAQFGTQALILLEQIELLLNIVCLQADSRFSWSGIYAVARYAQALGNFCYRVATLSDLLDCLRLELVRVALACHESSDLKNTISGA